MPEKEEEAAGSDDVWALSTQNDHDANGRNWMGEWVERSASPKIEQRNRCSLSTPLHTFHAAHPRTTTTRKASECTRIKRLTYTLKMSHRSPFHHTKRQKIINLFPRIKVVCGIGTLPSTISVGISWSNQSSLEYLKMTSFAKSSPHTHNWTPLESLWFFHKERIQLSSRSVTHLMVTQSDLLRYLTWYP